MVLADVSYGHNRLVLIMEGLTLTTQHHDALDHSTLEGKMFYKKSKCKHFASNSPLPPPSQTDVPGFRKYFTEQHYID